MESTDTVRLSGAGADSAADPLISVIVPVRDGAADVLELLAALERQTLPAERFEVMIGDDGSADGLPTAIRGSQPWARVVAGPRRNSYHARNRAAQAARGPVLAFCDSDCRPDPTWLEAGLEVLERADIAPGLIRLVAPAPPSVWALLDIESFLDQERAAKAGGGSTANLFVRRELFERVGGFDESLPSGGDFDFVQRCVASGGRLAVAHEAVVRHPTRDTARAFLGKLWRTSRAVGARRRRAGRRVPLLNLVPVLQPLAARRQLGLPLTLNRARLRANGVAPRAWDDVRALPVMYGLAPMVGGAAQLTGWLDARRSR